MSRRGLAIFGCLLAFGCRSAPLAGSAWVAEEIDGHGVLAGVRSTLVFQSAERAVGAAGCNHWFASLQLSGTALRFEHAGATRMACEPPAMEQESRFLSALEAVRSYRLEGTTLWLLDESQAERLRLTRTTADAS